MVDILMGFIFAGFGILYMSGESGDYSILYISAVIYLFVRSLSLFLSDCIISKKFTFRIISLKTMLLLISWDIIWYILLEILLLISEKILFKISGVVLAFDIIAMLIISVIFYLIIWFIEIIFILPWIFKKRAGFEYIANSKLNLFIISSVHRIILFLLVVLHVYLTK